MNGKGKIALRKWWIIPTLAAVLAVGGLAYWSYDLYRDRQQMVTYLNNRNQRAFYEMVGHVENMEVMLSKGIVSNSPRQRMMIFSDIWQQAWAAQENLTEIPIAETALTRTSGFLSQTGDYTWSLAKKYARGIAVKPEELQKLNQLHTEAGLLAAELQKIESTAADGLLTWGEVRNQSNRKLKTGTTVPDGLQKIDKKMQEFPTLIYDGPFSDHIVQRKPLGLTGKNIDRDRAALVARKFVEAGSSARYKVVKTETVNGIIPAFRVHLVTQNAKNPPVAIDVAKKGGHVLMMLNNRTVDRAALPAKQAVSIAGRFLKDRGITGMEATYTIEQQNTGVVLFEYKQDGVLIYPDLMKVKVALDNGQVTGFEGTGFIMNHHDRKLPKPKISEDEARSAVNRQLKITSTRLAVIPLENLQEVLVYEFRGDLNGDTFIVYINAATGEEERILRVIDSKSGPVTM